MNTGICYVLGMWIFVLSVIRFKKNKKDKVFFVTCIIGIYIAIVSIYINLFNGMYSNILMSIAYITLIIITIMQIIYRLKQRKYNCFDKFIFFIGVLGLVLSMYIYVTNKTEVDLSITVLGLTLIIQLLNSISRVEDNNKK